MVNLNDDQKVELEIELIRLQVRGVITDEQHLQIMQAVLGIQPSPEEAEYERRATAPTSKPGNRRATA